MYKTPKDADLHDEKRNRRIKTQQQTALKTADDRRIQRCRSEHTNLHVKLDFLSSTSLE